MDVITPPTPQSEEPDDARLSRLEEQFQRYRISRDGWTIAVLAIAAVVLIGSIVGIGLALRKDDGGTAALPRETVSVSLSEFAIELSAATITEGGQLAVTNDGTMIHNVGIEGTDLITPDIQAGGTATLDV